MSDSYEQVIARKSASVAPSGFAVSESDLAPHLFPHQRDLTRWALRRGRAAVFADTGLGKAIVLLEWARHVSGRGRVLVLAPLAVGQQLEREARRFGVDAAFSRSDTGGRIVIANYQMLHAFDPAQFAGVVLDESAILKFYDGKTRTRIIEAFARTPYKLACTATPAPNDFTELGNHSEFLGLKTRMEMLSEFFVHDGGTTQDWRIKGHAIAPFWRWVATWGAVVRMPSDLGYPDGDYVLPPLTMTEHVVEAAHDHRETGMLFATEARTLGEQRAVRRASIAQRVAKVMEIICGNQSTTIVVEIDTPRTMTIESCASDKQPQTQQPVASTWPTITKQILTDGQKPQSNGGNRRTENDERGMPLTRSSEIDSRQQSARGVQRKSETAPSARPTESPQLTTITSSQSNADDAPSAVDSETSTSAGSACTSTTTTRPEKSAGSCARAVTSDSATSETTPSDSSARLHTFDGDQFVVWCELNDEQDAIARSLGSRCVSISGATHDDDKIAMCDRWMRGEVQVLVSKVSIFGAGMNFQNCHRVIFAGASHSFEGVYQAIRRCWRFGQKRPVRVDVVRADVDQAIVENYRRKEREFADMAREMTAHVGAAVRAEVRGLGREFNHYDAAQPMRVPAWIESER